MKNNNITLHYAQKDLKGEDIVPVKLNSRKELDDFITSLSYRDEENTVYIFCDDRNVNPSNEFDEFSVEILIESDFSHIINHVKSIPDFSDTTIFLQEYESFEEAYKVALSLRELNKLCYNQE